MIDKDINLLKAFTQFRYVNDDEVKKLPKQVHKDISMAIENVLKELEIKDKMIDAIAETMALDIMYADEDKDVQIMKEKIKETYRKKVEK